MNSGWLSHEEAQSLKDRGEWISTSDVSGLVRRELVRFWPNITQWLQIEARQYEDATVNILGSYLLHNVEQKAVIVSPSASDDRSLLLGHDTIIKIEPTIKEGSWEALAMLASITAILNSHTDMISRFVLLKKCADSARGLMNTLSNSCEKLLDEKEKFVVSVIVKAKSRLAIGNYDAAARNDYTHSIGKIDPALDDLVDVIVQSKSDGRLPAGWDGPVADWQNELLTILGNLKQRKVLQEKNGCWIL